MNKKILHDSTASATSLNFLTQTENLNGQRVVHITEVDTSNLNNTEEAVMGMTHGHADPNKVFYDKVGTLVGGDSTDPTISGDTTVFVAPGGEGYANGDPFLGKVHGWAAYNNGVITTPNDPTSELNGAAIFDTTDPQQSTPFGQPTLSVEQVTQQVIGAYHQDMDS